MDGRRRLASAVGAVLLAVPLAGMASVTVAAGAPANPAIDGFGTLRCTAAGKVTFTPALLAGGTSSTKVKVVAGLSHCTGSGSGSTVTGGSVTGTITGTPAGDCTVTQMSTSGSLKATYRVKTGSPPLSPSTLSFNTVQATGGGPPITAQINGAPTSGSFVGDGSFLNLKITQTSPCVAQWTYTARGGSTFELG